MLSPRKIQELRHHCLKRKGARDEAKKRRITSTFMKRTLRLPGNHPQHLTARLGPILTPKS